MNDIKVIFLDMDNTIAVNSTCDDIEFYDGLYISKQPIQIVIDALKELYPQQKVILSKVQGGDKGIHEKLSWLQQYMPNENIVDYIFLGENEGYYMKAVHAEKWLTINDMTPKNALVIDDSKKVLQYCKEYGFQVQYPQQVICDYEKHLVLKR